MLHASAALTPRPPSPNRLSVSDSNAPGLVVVPDTDTSYSPSSNQPPSSASPFDQRYPPSSEYVGSLTSSATFTSCPRAARPRSRSDACCVVSATPARAPRYQPSSAWAPVEPASATAA